MDGEEGLQKGFTPTSDLITIQVENGTTYIKFDSLPLAEEDTNPPSVDGILTQSAFIRGISIQLISSSSSSLTPSPTGTKEAVSVTIEFFTKKEADDEFKPLLLEGNKEAKVRMRNTIIKTYCRPLLSKSSNLKLVKTKIEFA